MNTFRKKHKHSKNALKNKNKKYTKKRRNNLYGGVLNTNNKEKVYKSSKQLVSKSTKDLVAKSIQNREKNYGNMLKMACKNPGNCLALGPYDEKIKLFFEDFKNFNLIDNRHVKKIGTPSVNGFIIELPFKKQRYTALTALKCSRKATSDNLFYEYYVGKYFINNYIKKLPCFVETYNLCEFKNNEDYIDVEKSIESNTLTSAAINTKINLIDPDDKRVDLFDYSCLKNKLLCVLIQHFDKFISFGHEYKNNFQNIKYDIYNLLFQTYYGLCYLGANYTHYDLHMGNVFLYKPFDGNTCILMRYHRNNKVFEFKSEYVVKIIDYGRNYFNNGNITSATIVSEKICKAMNCKPFCGQDVGYGIIKGDIDDNNYNKKMANDPDYNFYWINPLKPNISHDLRFVANLNETLSPSGVDNVKYDHRFGTREVKGGNENDIKNIYNLLERLQTVIEIFNKTRNEKKYASWKVGATMDIYDDGSDYNFVVLPDY